MTPFQYEWAGAPVDAINLAARHGTKFLAGGTNLVDLMHSGVEAPERLVDINRLGLNQVVQNEDGGVSIGALVRNSDLANHPLIKTGYPLLSQALLSGASVQLRNMASTGGNLLQRTRCYYFVDLNFTACNKRRPGSGCAAIGGSNRIHAILGQTDKGSDSGESCIAVHPSDMCVALAALNASVEVDGLGGPRSIAFADFHKLPGATPWVETALRPDELIVAVTLPPPQFAGHACYLKARDRHSYAFGLATAAAGLGMTGGVVTAAGLALGAVALKPWRVPEAEAALVGKPATSDGFERAADILLEGARGYQHNTFKIGLARQVVVRALTLAAEGAWVSQVSS